MRVLGEEHSRLEPDIERPYVLAKQQWPEVSFVGKGVAEGLQARINIRDYLDRGRVPDVFGRELGGLYDRRWDLCSVLAIVSRLVSRFLGARQSQTACE
jgi:hypothetical protein